LVQRWIHLHLIINIIIIIVVIININTIIYGPEFIFFLHVDKGF
jgi:hypothetical protein